MAQGLKRVAGWLAWLAGFAAMPALAAESQRDPTRPPPGVALSTSTGSPGADGGLQAVLISPQRRAAIINGQTIELGDSYDEERLVEVSEGRAVLQGRYGRRVLHLHSIVKTNTRESTPLIKRNSAAGHAAHKEHAK
jgi:hypothetical protein